MIDIKAIMNVRRECGHNLLNLKENRIICSKAHTGYIVF